MKTIFAILLIAGILLAPFAVAHSAVNVTLPPYLEKTLGNGLEVFVMETREVPLVSISLVVPAGSAMDEIESAGTANLTSRLLMKGAAGMTAEEIAEAIEATGGSIRCSTGRDYTKISGDFMAKDLSFAMDMLARIVLEPSFPEEELAREKNLLVAELAGIKDYPMQFASREFMRALMEPHPYAHPVEGDRKSIEAVSRGKILAFFEANYIPKGSVLAVVGDVDAKKTLSLVQDKFGQWKGEKAGEDIPKLEPVPYRGRRVLIIDKPDVTQSQIRFGNVTVPRGSAEEFPLLVSNTVLGGGFTSRLMDEIRVNRGLSYGARSSNTNYKYGGIFGVYTYTKNATLRECIDVALDQVKRMRTEKLTENELASAKKYITGLFPFEIETNNDLANWLVDLTYYGIPLSYIEKYSANVSAVTADDCLEVAKRRYWLEDNLMLLITNYAETGNQLEGLGNIEVIAADELE